MRYLSPISTGCTTPPRTRRSALWRRGLGAVAAGVTLVIPAAVSFVLGGGGTSAAAGSAPHVDPTSSWTVYHGNPLGTGVDPSGVTFSPPNLAWTSPVLDGQLYGEPLEAAGRVYVATENDSIYALSANTGAILWSFHVGTAVPSAALCGDISPTVGITGTPVIDAGRGEIFAVADELSGGSPSHVLVGLNMYTGSSMMEQVVNPPGQSPLYILQRTGLNISDGNVVFGYGGDAALCGTYSGWIVSVPEGGGNVGYYQTTPNFTKGAVWMGGAAPEVDAAGNIWAATGNGSPFTPYDGGDSVIEAVAEVGAGAVVRPEQLVQPKCPRRGPRIGPADTALERDDPADRQVKYVLPAESGEPRRHRGADNVDLGVFLVQCRRRHRGSRDRRLHTVPGRGRGHSDQPVPQCAVAGGRQQRRTGTADRRRWSRVDDRPGWHARWPQPRERRHGATGLHR